jgi:hypothetical protein
VNPDLLIWSSPDRSLFAVGKNGELLRFDELGDVTTTGILPGKRSLYALPLPETAPLSNPPGVDANTPAAKVALPAKAHWAMDSAGDIYIADPAAHVIRKLDPAGKPLALIGAGRLVDPEALAVSPDGTVFVVDGVRVRVIWAHVPPRLLVKAAT